MYITKLIELLNEIKDNIPDLYFNVYSGVYIEIIIRYRGKNKVFVVQDIYSEQDIKEIIYTLYKEKGI